VYREVDRPCPSVDEGAEHKEDRDVKRRCGGLLTRICTFIESERHYHRTRKRVGFHVSGRDTNS